MDYSDPPRRVRPSRYSGLVPNEDRTSSTGRAPWDDEPFPASSGGYADTFNGTSPGRYSNGFTDAFYGASTGAFGEAASTGAFGQAPSTGTFGRAPSTGTFSQADTVADIRPLAAARPRQRRSAVELLAGAVAGFLAAAVALGVANLTAAFVRPQASPIIAVGGAFIDRTPPALKNFAVEKFGENDKNMLLLGMYVAIALIAIVIGMLAWRRIYIGVAGIGLFGLFGAFVAYTRPESHLTDVIPSIVGGFAGIAAIIWLIRAANQRARNGSRSSYRAAGQQNGWAA